MTTTDSRFTHGFILEQLDLMSAIDAALPISTQFDQGGRILLVVQHPPMLDGGANVIAVAYRQPVADAVCAALTNYEEALAEIARLQSALAAAEDARQQAVDNLHWHNIA